MVKISHSQTTRRVTIVDRIFHARLGDTDRGEKRQYIIVSGLISTWEDPQDFTFHLPWPVDRAYVLDYLMDWVSKGNVVELAVDANGYLKIGIRRDPVAINIEWLLNWWEKPAEKKTLHIAQMPKE